MEGPEADSEEALTLHALADGLVATDSDGRITRMNPAAESLTGWTLAEALGRPLPEILKVVDAVTRAPVELSVGTFPEHARLISRTGPEVQLSGSLAPIRDRHG